MLDAEKYTASRYLALKDGPLRRALSELAQMLTGLAVAIAAAINGRVAAAGGDDMPAGGLMWWEGLTCPTGYEVLAQLQGRIVANAYALDPELAPLATGGEATHTHELDFNFGGVSGIVGVTYGGLTVPSDVHRHSVFPPSFGPEYAGNITDAQSNYPPFLALLPCMRVAA